MSDDKQLPPEPRRKRPLSTKPTAVANRKYRKRALLGTRIAPVEASEPRVETLIAGGYLREQDAENPRAIAKAVERFIDGAVPVRLQQT